MCGPALLSLLALALSLVLRNEKALAASTDGLASGVATKMCDFGTALDNAAGEARALTAKIALRREHAARNLGALTAALEASAQILNSSTEAATLRSHAAAARMAQRARDAMEGLTQIMKATMTAGDAASKAAAGIKEYMRVLGTVAGTNRQAVTCLDAEAKLTPGIEALKSKLGTACKHFFGDAATQGPQGFAEVIKQLTKQGKDTIITGTSGGVGSSGAKQTKNFGTEADNPNGKCNLFNIAAATQAGIGVAATEKVTYADTIELQFHSSDGKMTLLGATGTLAQNQSIGTIINALQNAAQATGDQKEEHDLCHVDQIDICNETNTIAAHAKKLIADAMNKRDETLNQAHNELTAQEEEHNNKDTRDGAAGTHKQSPGTRRDLEAPKGRESHTQTPASFAHQHKLSHSTLLSLFASLSANA
ncbi:hypothetical protein, conserved in T. vivax [Trypanosoma vivax Y486]|uniref:Uncharacterized protein n=1 Tax=Trypanosoma vivax (strain Y486) TaxID=1055687 RepID=F9WP82_TRYVY|nr:hypothetical protein, conserved in T. vivax [Trypanosoma vivax Y486]|eukprot:CCD19357.1 hypothetical protein, conserved in T. vivax [Trypanosoma vivax Y486]